ncbi:MULTISPECIES: ABC transporter substrate-binding protein [unclassified Streptomyces]|uniref:ABC transporter substrate-binding protein n=1 Tax=unclassified Streptomyces TaxID=2593676 RepID=UPI000CD568B6|nr:MULTISPECIES: ABC transporter substrate-binding protein [unclassified Streptomyces]
MFRSRRAAAALACAAPLILAGCGARTEAPPAAADTVTVERCGEEIEYRTPSKAVVYEAGSADKMLILGLADAIRGYVMPPANPPVEESPWAQEYAGLEMLSDDVLNRELVVGAEADFVVAGWQSGFSDERGITPEILDRLGIQSFMHSETCYNYPEHPLRVGPFDGLYLDLERLGAIFGVEDEAAEVVTGLRERVAEVEAGAPDGDPVRVFLYDSGVDQPFTSGNQAPPQEIIELAGGENIYSDLEGRWTGVSWESVIEADPEVILILDYGDQPAEEKIAFLKSSPALSEVTAVREDNFHLLDFNEAISGPRIVDGVENVGAYLRSLDR